MADELWIVGEVTSLDYWKFKGVFSTEQLAIEVCKDSTYFVYAVTLNKFLLHNFPEWVSAFFPLANSV